MGEVMPVHDPSGWTCPKCSTRLANSNGVCRCGYQAGQCIGALEAELAEASSALRAIQELCEKSSAYRGYLASQGGRDG